LTQYKKYHPSGNLKFYYVRFFQSLNFRILIEKILPISLKSNFTPNTLGCYGLLKKNASTWFYVKKENLTNSTTTLHELPHYRKGYSTTSEMQADQFKSSSLFKTL